MREVTHALKPSHPGGSVMPGHHLRDFPANYTAVMCMRLENKHRTTHQFQFFQTKKKDTSYFDYMDFILNSILPFLVTLRSNTKTVQSEKAKG